MFRHKNAMRNELTGDEIRLVDFLLDASIILEMIPRTPKSQQIVKDLL